MKRPFLLLLAGAVVAVTIPYALRVSQRTSAAEVASLLPKETIALIHMPDFNGIRNDWHRSDIFQLYSEPAVQDFLRRPLDHWRQQNPFSQTASEIEQLDPKDAFVAFFPSETNENTFLAGFRFRGKQEAAEQIINRWREKIHQTSSKPETIEYEKHKIDVYAGIPASVIITYDRDWFFVSNETMALKALLDRADGRVVAPAGPSTGGKDRQSLLSEDESFRTATKQMPTNYALEFYLQPKGLVEKLATVRASGIAPAQAAALDHIRSICATTRFDNGKIHDVIYVQMPESTSNTRLIRDSVGLGTTETILYAASCFDLSKHMAMINTGAANAGGNILGGWLQKVAIALGRANINPAEWDQAFGSEAGLLVDWAKSAHWPSGVASIAVKDFERAKKMAVVLARASDEDASWQESDRDGVHYIAMQAAPGFRVLHPTIAVSNRVMIIGLDPGSVESVIRRSENATGDLARSDVYKAANNLVPAPTNFFAYVDLAKLYGRFDETVRPILMMWAAFMPGINRQLDLSRIPSQEIITKHLSPIVSSQRYSGNGYVTESVGPITLNQTGAALVALGVFGYRSGLTNLVSGMAPQSPVLPSIPAPKLATPTPAATP